KTSAHLVLLLLALFQQNSQFSNCLAIFWSACRFLDTNQRRKIDTFESDSESIDIERTRQQILVTLPTSHFAEEIDVTETCCESKIQAATDRLGVPREWQFRRSIAEIWP